MADESIHVEEAGAAITETHAEVQHEAKGGLPQFDMSTWPSQIFWLAILFAALYVVMAKSALPKVKKVLDDRAARIRGDLDAAEKARTEADALKVSLEAKLASARAESKAKVDAARAEAMSKVDARKTAVEADLAAKAEKASKEIAAAKAATLSNLEAISADVTASLVEKLGVTAKTGSVEAAVKAELANGRG